MCAFAFVSTLLLLVVFALATTQVHAHGQLLEPMLRPISTKFRADAGALRQAGDNELQWAPLENLSQRKQKDFPEAATFDIMNGCRGMVYEASNPVTALQAGVAFPVKWYIQAPHPGYAEFSIVKPKTGAGGKISYEKVALLKRLEPFGTVGGTFETAATVPASVTGCEKAGACALQMYWYSEVANQTYPTCADITIRSSGGLDSASGSGPTSGKRVLQRDPSSDVVGSSMSVHRDAAQATTDNEDDSEYVPATVAPAHVTVGGSVSDCAPSR